MHNTQTKTANTFLPPQQLQLQVDCPHVIATILGAEKKDQPLSYAFFNPPLTITASHLPHHALIPKLIHLAPPQNLPT